MQSKSLPSNDMESSIRIDKLFYYLRFTKSRALAQKICKKRRVRLDGNPIRSGHEKVVIGAVITFAREDDILTISVDAIPIRRGSASEAQSHYQLLNQI